MLNLTYNETSYHKYHKDIIVDYILHGVRVFQNANQGNNWKKIKLSIKSGDNRKFLKEWCCV